jgi:hypothetical protein
LLGGLAGGGGFTPDGGRAGGVPVVGGLAIGGRVVGGRVVGPCATAKVEPIKNVKTASEITRFTMPPAGSLAGKVPCPEYSPPRTERPPKGSPAARTRSKLSKAKRRIPWP